MTDREAAGSADILLVEDNPGDVRLTQEAFDEAQIDGELHVATDGEDALDFLYCRGAHADTPAPDLVLLDLNLPKRSGIEVLEEIRNDPDLQRTPVIVLTGSKAPEDVTRCYELHSNAYLTKPVDPDEFVELVEAFETFWLRLAQLPPTPE